MKNLYVLCGVPGSGKSTWTREHANFAGDKKSYRVISRDQIRFSMVEDDEPYFSKEKEVFDKFIEEIKDAIINCDNIFVDATHINESSRCKLLRPLGDLLKGVQVNAVVVRVPVETALIQNELRKGTRAYVPEEVIRNMYSNFTMPSFEEGFDVVYVYRPNITFGSQYTIFEKEDK